jgi:poly-gamma-glutamate capsule biosynthesis protein CapA/YwtB (metallophosphatase superfamily)
MAKDNLSLFLAGDSMVMRPWSQVTDPAFLQLVDEIRAADVSVTNLETVIHEFKGYAQHDCGGAYTSSPPEVATELKWAGFDMLVHANNHAFDYGSSAVLETIEHVERAGLVLAGSGADLQRARAPAYLRCDAGTVGLVSMAATFTPYGQASRSRPDVRGRPGVNPLTLTRRNRAVVVPPGVADRIRAIGRLTGRPPHKLEGRSFRVGFRFHVGRHLGIERAHQLTDVDRNANLATIAEAASEARIVVVSIHVHADAHGRWLQEFAVDSIENGADVVFVHGPHEVGAIELHRGKPIFYSMGDLAMEIESVARLPSEAYERVGLGDDASPGDAIALARKHDLKLLDRRRVFEGFSAVLTLADGRVSRIRLLPLDLQFDGPPDRRGRPRIASAEMGRRIVDTVASLSRRHGTRVRYDPAANCGEVEIRR